MKAAIYPGHGGQIVIEDIPDPTSGANDVIIKVDRCGICGTDLSMTRGGNWDFGENTQFGHEFAGKVIEIGRNVDRLKKGDRIAVLPSVGCGICAGCGFENNVLCHDMPDTAAAGFAEFARVFHAGVSLHRGRNG
jgi:threonine dehydrogenase-like Zn-dependent dehydrogenase